MPPRMERYLKIAAHEILGNLGSRVGCSSSSSSLLLEHVTIWTDSASDRPKAFRGRTARLHAHRSTGSSRRRTAPACSPCPAPRCRSTGGFLHRWRVQLLRHQLVPRAIQSRVSITKPFTRSCTDRCCSERWLRGVGVRQPLAIVHLHERSCRGSGTSRRSARSGTSRR